MNLHCRDEPVANDTIYSDTLAIYGGSTYAQLFVGKYSLVSNAYCMKTDNQFLNTLEGNIHARGEMSELISDRAQSDIINCAQSILWTLFIDY